MVELVFPITAEKRGPQFITSSLLSFTASTLTMNSPIAFMQRSRTTQASVFQVPVLTVQLRFKKALSPEQVKADSSLSNLMIRT